jgi:hypothetical protein
MVTVGSVAIIITPAERTQHFATTTLLVPKTMIQCGQSRIGTAYTALSVVAVEEPEMVLQLRAQQIDLWEVTHISTAVERTI